MQCHRSFSTFKMKCVDPGFGRGLTLELAIHETQLSMSCNSSLLEISNDPAIVTIGMPFTTC